MAEIQIPALGRSFDLGECYNRYKDKPLTKKNSASLKSVNSSILESSSFCIFAEGEPQERDVHLQIDHHTKQSILCDFIEVGGAAKYVHDRKPSKNEVRVVLKFSHTTHVEEVKREDFPQVKNTSDATHVVSSIVYGCDIFIIFMQSIAEGESVADVRKKLEINASVIHSLLERSMSDPTLCNPGTNAITCKYFCDEELPFELATYNNVASNCQEIAQRVKQAKVPKLVTLHPLSGRRNRKLIHEVNYAITTKIERIIEHLHGLKMSCEQLRERRICLTFKHLKKNMNDLVNQMTQFKSDLVTLIAEARKQVTQHAKLNTALNCYEDLPSCYTNVRSYIDLKIKEAELLESYEERLLEKRVRQISDDGFERFVRNCNTFLFSLSVSQDVVPFKEMYRNYKNGVGPTDPLPVCKRYMDNIRKIDAYLDFIEANNGKPSIIFGFSLTVLADLNCPAAALYAGGSLTKLNIPIAPSVPQCIETSSTSVELTWSIPKDYSEQPSQYAVYYKPATAGSNEWSCMKTPNRERIIKIQELCLQTEYEFAVQSEFSHYVSPMSPVLTVETDPSSSCRIS